MSTGLTTNTSTPPDWMKTSSAPALGLTVNKPTHLILVQDKRPKDVECPKGTESGDILTEHGQNLGKTFTCVILGTTDYYIRLSSKKRGDPEDGKLIWKANKDEMSPEQRKETVWQKDPSTGKNFRLADYRIDFLCVEVGGPGFSTIDPRGLGPVVIGAKGMSVNPTEKFIAAINAKESVGYKALGLVCEFTSKVVSDNAVQAWHPKIVGVIGDKATFEKLLMAQTALRGAAKAAATAPTAEQAEYATSTKDAEEDVPF